ncbi:MAG TPA: hypothetical protein VFZ28_19290 [Burkholderiaceae bacterium]|nr:hypothetical protein [Burkholderiaceae bacterium]
MDLTHLGLLEASAILRHKTVSPVELTRSCLERIERLNPIVNASSPTASRAKTPKSCDG